MPAGAQRGALAPPADAVAEGLGGEPVPGVLAFPCFADFPDFAAAEWLADAVGDGWALGLAADGHLVVGPGYEVPYAADGRALPWASAALDASALAVARAADG